MNVADLPWISPEWGTVPPVDRRAGHGAPYAPPVDVEITPEPSEAERAAIEAALAESDGRRDGSALSAWRDAALQEGVGADDRDGSAPAL